MTDVVTSRSAAPVGLWFAAWVGMRSQTPTTSIAPTILLVEDDPRSGPILSELLQEQGYHVLLATEPSQALRAAADHGAPLALLLTDIRLPEMAGDELAARLRRSQPSLPVAFVSAAVDPPAGAAAYIQKPINFDALVQTIEMLLGREIQQPRGWL